MVVIVTPIKRVNPGLIGHLFHFFLIHFQYVRCLTGMHSIPIIFNSPTNLQYQIKHQAGLDPSTSNSKGGRIDHYATETLYDVAMSPYVWVFMKILVSVSPYNVALHSLCMFNRNVSLEHKPDTYWYTDSSLSRLWEAYDSISRRGDTCRI